MIYLLFYVSIVIMTIFVTLGNLESLRNTSSKLDLKTRNKTNEKIKLLEKELLLSFIWPWMLFKKVKDEYYFRKQN